MKKQGTGKIIKFAKELAPDIRVNCVTPGTIDTEMTRAAGEELIKQISENILVKVEK
jgi:NAD(P)-dependent dehydrogenase (short-subunit alcohol dehydrogenase family)